MGKVRGPYLCGLDAAVDVVGGKWKPLILWGLYDAEGPLRFGELRREVVGVSEKMLIQQLRELEADGIVHREVYAEVPPRVEYSLTEVGAQLNAALGPLGEWGFQHMESIVARKHPGFAAGTTAPAPTNVPGPTATPVAGSVPVPTAAPGSIPVPEPSTTGSTTAATVTSTPVTSTAPVRRADAVQRGGAAAGPARVDHPRRAVRPLRAPGGRTSTTPRTGQGEPGGQG